MYNLLNGVQLSTFFILPMLGKHPDEYPRFRDCFVGKMIHDFNDVDYLKIPKLKHGDENLISIYTRVGGNNRAHYQDEITKLKEMEGYVEDFDDKFDETYATFVFKVPDKFLKDFNLVKEGDLLNTSKEYKEIVEKVYPLLVEKLPWNFK